MKKCTNEWEQFDLVLLHRLLDCINSQQQFYCISLQSIQVTRSLQHVCLLYVQETSSIINAHRDLRHKAEVTTYKVTERSNLERSVTLHVVPILK